VSVPTRGEAWELMSKDEKKYFYKFKGNAQNQQIYATFIDLASYKELACIFMKVVDDECVAFDKPKMPSPH